VLAEIRAWFNPPRSEILNERCEKCGRVDREVVSTVYGPFAAMRIRAVPFAQHYNVLADAVFFTCSRCGFSWRKKGPCRAG
jgi:hypothetical protein